MTTVSGTMSRKQVTTVTSLVLHLVVMTTDEKDAHLEKRVADGVHVDVGSDDGVR